MTEAEFNAAVGKAADDALVGIESIGRAAQRFRAVAVEHFGGGVATHELDWFVNELRRELTEHLELMRTTSSGDSWSDLPSSVRDDILRRIKPSGRA